MRVCRLLCVVVVGLFALPAAVYGSTITEVEVFGSGTNDSIATAQMIAASAFTTPVAATVFNPPGDATATITGTTGFAGTADYDFYGFYADPGRLMIDVDGAEIDTIVALYDAAGTPLAYNDDSNPLDPGSTATLDSFIGVYNVATGGTYYFVIGPFAPGVSVSATGSLTRPDGGSGGVLVSGLTLAAGGGTTRPLAYTVQLSLQDPGDVTGTPVPEPTTVVSLGVGLAALAARRWRHRSAS